MRAERSAWKDTREAGRGCGFDVGEFQDCVIRSAACRKPRTLSKQSGRYRRNGKQDIEVHLIRNCCFMVVVYIACAHMAYIKRKRGRRAATYNT